MSGTAQRRMVGVQAVYYVLTGLWPLVSLPTFEAVTGPKTDDWLVEMVGLLAVVIGATLGVAVARRETLSGELLLSATGSALAFAWIDVHGVLSGQIGRSIWSMPDSSSGWL